MLRDVVWGEAEWYQMETWFYMKESKALGKLHMWVKIKYFYPHFLIYLKYNWLIEAIITTYFGVYNVCINKMYESSCPNIK